MADQDRFWNPQRSRALQLVAENLLPDAKIAEQCNCSTSTVRTWKAHPEFQRKLREIWAKVQEDAVATGVAVKANRIKHLNDRAEKLRVIVAERAQDASMQGVPGGHTGYIVLDTGTPRIDYALLKEQREIEKQAAQEMGQFQGDAAETTVKVLVGVDMERV